MMDSPRKHFYDFGRFRLDPIEHVLMRDGRIVPLTPKVFETLLMLVEANGHLVEKDDFFQEIWPDSFVEEVNLAKNISVLRKTLAENDPEAAIYIETVPKRGYKFTVPIRKIEARETPESSPQQEKTPKSVALGLLRTRLSLVLIILLSVLSGVGFWYYGTDKGPVEAEQIGSLAVMPPVVNGIKDGEKDLETKYLTDGLYDGLISKISQFPDLVVKSKSAVARFKNKESPAQQIGRELEVKSILTGNIVPQESDLKLTFRLIDTETGNILWDRQYVRRKKDLVLLEREIARALAEHLRPGMTAADADRITRIYTENPAAYEAYLKGRYFGSRRTFEELRKAEKFYLEALEIDPDYALAWSGLADLYWWQTQSSEALRDNEAYLRMKLDAEKSLHKALELAPDLAETRTSLAVFKLYDWEFKGSEREFLRAIELNPNYVRAHMLYARLLGYTGNHKKALREIGIAHQLSPLTVSSSLSVAIHYYAGQYKEAAKMASEALELRPKDHATMHYLSIVLTQLGRFEEALAMEKQALSLDTEGYNPAYMTQLAVVHAKSGNREEARRILKELIADEPKGWTSPHRIAVVYAELEEKEAAFQWLEKAFREKAAGLFTLKVNPSFKPLHSDERWPELLRRVGFE